MRYGKSQEAIDLTDGGSSAVSLRRRAPNTRSPGNTTITPYSEFKGQVTL